MTLADKWRTVQEMLYRKRWPRWMRETWELLRDSTRVATSGKAPGPLR